MRLPLGLTVLAALIVGVYARFKGLGTWPFGVDEYYVSRSIDFILMSGLPEYPCGGFYQRGIVYQYLVAGLRLLDLTPELASRLVASVSSLAVLPAAWLLARRLHSAFAGWLVVIVLSLSVWEIEMARFARMYAPFQAVFGWYLVYFLRFAVDRERRAALPMLLLSVLGVLTWEGGMLLGATNLLPALIQHQQGRIQRQGWLYLCIAVPITALMLVSQINWRIYSAIPALPESALAADNVVAPVAGPGFSGIWLLAGLVPLALGAVALPWLWSMRQRWLAVAGLLLGLLAAAASQLLVAASVLLLLLLLGLLDWRELVRGRARWFLAALAAALAGWLAFAAVHELRSPDSNLQSLILACIYQVAGYPDVITEILRPWASTLPVVTVLLALALAGLAALSIFREPRRSDIAVLLVLLLVMAMAVGVSAPPRHETRYTFFLYPLLVVLGVTAGAMAVEKWRGQARSAQAATAIITLLLFTVCGDFQPRHILNIDSEAVNFREGLSQKQKAHYYPRSDFRAAADWLQEHVQPGDVVISGIPTIPQYYSGASFSFLDEDDDRYFAYACQRGTVERWSNLPLLHETDSLDDFVDQGTRLVIVLYPSRMERLVAAAQQKGWKYSVEWPTKQRDIAVVTVN